MVSVKETGGESPYITQLVHHGRKALAFMKREIDANRNRQFSVRAVVEGAGLRRNDVHTAFGWLIARDFLRPTAEEELGRVTFFPTSTGLHWLESNTHTPDANGPVGARTAERT